MSEPKKLRPINNAELAAKGVVALGVRPNTRQQYGVGGLTAQELQRWFDGLAVLLAGKINELQTAFGGADAADYIPLKTPIVDAANNIEIRTLGDLIRAYSDGTFASHIMQAALPGYVEGRSNLQHILNVIATEMGKGGGGNPEIPNKNFLGLVDQTTSTVYLLSVDNGALVMNARSNDIRADTGTREQASYTFIDASTGAEWMLYVSGGQLYLKSGGT